MPSLAPGSKIPRMKRAIYEQKERSSPFVILLSTSVRIDEEFRALRRELFKQRNSFGLKENFTE